MASTDETEPGRDAQPDDIEAQLYKLWVSHERLTRRLRNLDDSDFEGARPLILERSRIRQEAMVIPVSTMAQLRYKIGIIRTYLPPPSDDNEDLFAAHSILNDVDRCCGGPHMLPSLDGEPEHAP